MTTDSSRRILFFDGVCSLCNVFVDFLIRRQKKRLFYFAPLQGRTAGQMLDSKVSDGLKSVVYFRDGEVFFESTAALRVLADLGGLWRFVLVFMIIPACIRNSIYRFIARNRYKWFGQKQTCRLPSDEENKFFLN